MKHGVCAAGGLRDLRAAQRLDTATALWRTCSVELDDLLLLRRVVVHDRFAPAEMTGGSYYFLGLTALGRQEEWEEPIRRAAAAHAASPDFK